MWSPFAYWPTFKILLTSWRRKNRNVRLKINDTKRQLKAPMWFRYATHEYMIYKWAIYMAAAVKHDTAQSVDYIDAAWYRASLVFFGFIEASFGVRAHLSHNDNIHTQI